jgi:hypothetical protein
MVQNNQKTIRENCEKQNKFSENRKKWVNSKFAENGFDRTMEGVPTDMENGL